MSKEKRQSRGSNSKVKRTFIIIGIIFLIVGVGILLALKLNPKNPENFVSSYNHLLKTNPIKAKGMKLFDYQILEEKLDNKFTTFKIKEQKEFKGENDTKYYIVYVEEEKFDEGLWNKEVKDILKSKQITKTDKNYYKYYLKEKEQWAKQNLNKREKFLVKYKVVPDPINGDFSIQSISYEKLGNN